ncbi:DUF975 family protein [Sporolactobacillus pectinivorans]|uniref:DUF975 family protein n=1 Tax=Sporolactobacillus pectinivorans TaxID=1591408 RepID=UPI000C25D61D|nr:DUF975 family protein [Sporolactobacillus pectinivorans]
MRISEIKKKARDSLENNWAISSLLVFIAFFVISGFQDLYEIFISGGLSIWIYNWEHNIDLPPSVLLTEIIYSIIVSPISITFYWFFLGLARSENPQIGEVFTVYTNIRKVLKLIWVSFVLGFFVAMWTLLFIVPGIIKSIAYAQTYFILKDHPEYSATEAIAESRKMMRGYKWKFFVMELSFIGWAILSVFTLFIGMLWLAPYFFATLAVFYNERIKVPEEVYR